MFSMTTQTNFLNHPATVFNNTGLNKCSSQENFETLCINSNIKPSSTHNSYFNNRTIQLEKKIEQRTVSIPLKTIHYSGHRDSKINSSYKKEYYPLSFDEHSQFIDRVLNAEEFNAHKRLSIRKKNPTTAKKSKPNTGHKSEPILIKFENLHVNNRKNLTRESVEKHPALYQKHAAHPKQSAHPKNIPNRSEYSSMHVKQRQYIKV